MKTSTKQSRKSLTAQRITTLHANIKRSKATAATLFGLALSARQDARDMTKEVGDLAQAQRQLKRELKGPPKAKRPAKADTRKAAPDGIGGAAPVRLVETFPFPTASLAQSMAEEQLSNLG